MKRLVVWVSVAIVCFIGNGAWAAVNVLFITGQNVLPDKLIIELRVCTESRFQPELLYNRFPYLDLFIGGRLIKLRLDGYSVEQGREDWGNNIKNREAFWRELNSIWGCLSNRGKTKLEQPDTIWSLNEDIKRWVLPHYEVGPDWYRYPMQISDAQQEEVLNPITLREIGVPSSISNSYSVLIAILDTSDGTNDPFVIPGYMQGHGTPIAGLIGGILGSRSSNVEIRNYPVCNIDGICYDSDIIPIISDLSREAREKGVVANLSFGSVLHSALEDTKTPSPLQYTLEKAASNGVLIAAAAGNMHLSLAQCNPKNYSWNPPLNCFVNGAGTAHQVFPAAYSSGIKNLLAVGSLQLNSRQLYERAPSSWLGGWVSVSAPGRAVKIPNQGVYQGTSFATPVVTAALAILRSKYPTARDVLNQLRTCISNDVTLGPGVGSGRINPAKCN